MGNAVSQMTILAFTWKINLPNLTRTSKIHLTYPNPNPNLIQLDLTQKNQRLKSIELKSPKKINSKLHKLKIRII